MNARKLRLIAVAGLVVMLTFVLVGGAVAAKPEAKAQVLIGFTQPPGPNEQALIHGVGGTIKCTYRLIPVIAAAVPESAIAGLLRNPNVTHVNPDGPVYAIGETLPWGVDRIDAEVVHSTNTGYGIKVAIIDTGIDKDHPDLEANIKGGVNFVAKPWWATPDPEAWDDDNGHGSHVAGTVAAVDNEEGVIGVAPEAFLYGVKVLDKTGSGYWSDVIAGIDWSVDPDGDGDPSDRMDVINMSLGASSAPDDVETACIAAYDAGIVIVAAAGNNGNSDGTGDNVIYPARYASVIAVAATDSTDERASWSSTGSDVELAAPGVSIPSTYKDGGYDTKSGTSMASPHVAGTAALVIFSGVVNNGDVRLQLRSTAEDLGATGWDTWYGYGLVDAAAAVGTTPDTTPPEISWATGDTSSTTGEPVTISATITDDVGVVSATVHYTPIDGTETTVAMTDVGADVWSAEVPVAEDKVGTITYYLTAQDGGGNTARDPAVDGSYNITVTDNDAPIADAGLDQSVLVDEIVYFDGSGSSDNINITSYSWDFDASDGIQENATGVTASHVYTTADTYIVTLTVDDAAGNGPVSDTLEVTVSELDTTSPTISGATGNISGTTGEPVTISATITDDVDVVSATVHYTPINGSETTVSMTEGPADFWSADVPVAEDKVGTITYYITAQDAGGNPARDPAEGSYNITVTDNDAPIAEAGLDQSVLVDETVAFDGSGSSDNIGITSYSWDFDNSDGIQVDATGVTASHEYTIAGTYIVTLTVYDAAGNSGSDTLEVTVSAAPTIDVTIAKFSARDVRKDNYAISAQIKNEGTTAVTITARVVIYNLDWTVADDTLVDKVDVTIDAGGRVNLKWDDPCTTLDPGSYIAKVTVVEEPGEEATDTFEVK